LYIYQNLSPVQKKQFASKLFRLSKIVYGNLSPKIYKTTFLDPHADRSYITVCRNEMDEMVAFFSLHTYHLKIDEKKHIIFRSQTGVQNEYRRKTATIFFQILLFVYYKIMFPFTPIHGFFVILNPGLFAKLSHVLHYIYPSPDHEIPPKELELLKGVMQNFKLVPQNSSFPYLAEIGHNTNSKIKEDKNWQQSDNNSIQYYLKINPKYKQDTGIVTLIPFNWKNIILSSWTVVAYMAKRTLKQFYHYQSFGSQFSLNK